VEEFLLLLLHMAWTEDDTVEAEAAAGSDVRRVGNVFRRAVCVVVEECLTDVEARMSQIEAASGVVAGNTCDQIRRIFVIGKNIYKFWS
jgi:hypothetical protein